MKCSLVQELLDARTIVDQVDDLNEPFSIKDGHQYSVKEWFLDHPEVIKALGLNKLTYYNVDKRLNQKMADLF